jgi:16S rRNA (cytosine1402-N4)-methyltransferase
MKHHLSVMPNEVLAAFAECSCTLFIDGTTGAGGHSKLILEEHPEIRTFIAIDQDPQALEIAKTTLLPWESKVTFIHNNFKNILSVISTLKAPPDGILLDLGVSSMQLDNHQRGFSFSKDGPLDMRMDTTQPLTAQEIINYWSEDDLGYIFREYGEEKRWRLAARTIVHGRKDHEITTTKALVDLLSPHFKWNPKKGINPLTLIFQGLRIAVNGELEILQKALLDCIQALAPGGRLAVITFHSLEDRIVKNTFRHAADDKESSIGIGGLFLTKIPTVNLITRKALMPKLEEIGINPRARSAKLRVVEKR